MPFQAPTGLAGIGNADPISNAAEGLSPRFEVEVHRTMTTTTKARTRKATTSAPTLTTRPAPRMRPAPRTAMVLTSMLGLP